MQRLNSQFYLSKSLVFNLIALPPSLVHGKKHTLLEGNSSHLFQATLNTTCPLDAPAPFIGYQESLTDDVHTGLINETKEVNEKVDNNQLKYYYIILNAVQLLTQFMAALWPVPASSLWCNARLRLVVAPISGHSQSATWMQIFWW